MASSLSKDNVFNNRGHNLIVRGVSYELRMSPYRVLSLSQFLDDYPFPQHLDFARRPQSTLAEKDDQVPERVQEE